ncbi:MAG: hypothetical protein ACOC0D_09325 [Spirochaeta sp.]
MLDRLVHGFRRFYNILGNTVRLYIFNRPSPSTVSGYHGRRRVRYRSQNRDLETIRHEIEWIERFRKSDLYHFVPRLLDASVEFGNAYYDIQYYPYPSLSVILHKNMNASFFVRRRWDILFHGLAETLYRDQNSLEVPPDYLQRELFEPLQRQIRSVPANSTPGKLLRTDRARINGAELIGITGILQLLMQNEEFCSRMVPQRLHCIHGRMSLENILCGLSAKRMVLLHGGGRPHGIYGDVAKDVARLYHELRGYLIHLQERQYSLILQITNDYPELDFEILNTGLRDRLVDNYVMVRDAVETWVQPHHGNVLYRASFYEACEPLFDLDRKEMRRSEQLMLSATAMQRMNEWLQRYHADLLDQLISSAPKEKQ